MTIEHLYQIYLQYPSVQTDTRKLTTGSIFFALKGDNFNGNQFAQKAIELGAAFVVVDEVVTVMNNAKIIRVENVLTTLQQLAKYHRQQFSIPFIAITGSNGKTTTKELIHAVLSTKYKTYTTEGNLNNHIGIPLTILSVKTDAEIAVIEMGANHQKEIEAYCQYAIPTHGLITNCGKAHLEGFGGIEGVRKGKGELFDYIRENNGTAFIMNDYDYLQEMSKEITSVITYGTDVADLTGISESTHGFLRVRITNGITIPYIQTHLVGDYNLPNVLAAICIGKYFGVEEDSIKNALENYTPSNSRSQLIEKDGNKIILDAYNANPTSMKAAIENFAKDPAPNKIMLLGGMMELGKESVQEHQSIVDLIKKYAWKDVVLVGGDFNKVQHAFTYFENSIEAQLWLKDKKFTQVSILIKGSRSIKMEKVLE